MLVLIMSNFGRICLYLYILKVFLSTSLLFRLFAKCHDDVTVCTTTVATKQIFQTTP